MRFGVPFAPMNPSYSEKDLDELLDLYGQQAYAEVKSDGYRCLVHADGSNVRLFTRQETEFEQQCFPDVIEAVAKIDLRKTILDCELKGTDKRRKPAFEQIKARARYSGLSDKAVKNYLSSDVIGQNPLELIPFDVLMFNGCDISQKPLTERRKRTEEMHSTSINPSVLYVCDSVERVRELYDELVEKQHVYYEGLVLKNPKSPHRLGSRDSDDWVKMKKFEPLDAVIVGFYTDSEAITGLLIAVLNGDHYETLGKVNAAKLDRSTGKLFSDEIHELLQGKELDQPSNNLSISPKMKDSERPTVYFDPSSSIVVEVKAMDIDRGANVNSCGYDGKTAYSMRIGYLQRIRDDKNPAMASTTELVGKMYKMNK